MAESSKSGWKQNKNWFFPRPCATQKSNFKKEDFGNSLFAATINHEKCSVCISKIPPPYSTFLSVFQSSSLISSICPCKLWHSCSGRVESSEGWSWPDSSGWEGSTENKLIKMDSIGGHDCWGRMASSQLWSLPDSSGWGGSTEKSRIFQPISH